MSSNKGILPIDVVLFKIKQAGGTPFSISFVKVDGSGQIKTVERCLYGKKAHQDTKMGILTNRTGMAQKLSDAIDRMRTSRERGSHRTNFMLKKTMPLIDMDDDGRPITPYISTIIFYNNYIVKH